MVLSDSIEFAGLASDVFEFFDAMDEARYRAWHPDHKHFRWTHGSGATPGNRFYFEEVIAGKLLKKTVVFTRVAPDSHLECEPTFWLMRLFLPRLVFRYETVSQGRIRFTAEIFIRTGPVGARLNKREFDAVRQHMRLEGRNLAAFVEKRRMARG